MRRVAIAAILCVALMSLIQACSRKPIEIVMAYQEASNAGDVEEVMSLFTEDAHFRVPGLFDLQGQEELRGLAEYDRKLHTVLEFGDLQERGDTVFCQVKETNDWIETADIGEFYYHGYIVVRRGRIETIEAAFVPETDQAFRRVMKPLMEWARAERPDKLAEMMPEGRFEYNAENAEKNLSLLREYEQGLYLQRDSGQPSWQKLDK
jgi:ketosteroid isomerase-like protein